MIWTATLLLAVALLFLVALATIAIVNAWRRFVAHRPEEAFAVAAVAVVALGVVGAVMEAVSG